MSVQLVLTLIKECPFNHRSNIHFQIKSAERINRIIALTLSYSVENDPSKEVLPSDLAQSLTLCRLKQGG